MIKKIVLPALLSSFFLSNVFAAGLFDNPQGNNGGGIVITSPVKGNTVQQPKPQNQDNKKKTVKKTGVIEVNYKNGNANKSSSKLYGQTIGRLMITKTKPEKIIQEKKKMAEYEKVLKAPIGKNIAEIRTVQYIPGQVIQLHIKVGYSTIVEFNTLDGNPIKFNYISVGSNVFKIKAFGNKMEIRAFDRYQSSNIMVGIDGISVPVIFNVTESTDGDYYDTFVRVKLADTFNEKVGSSEDAKIKSLILKEIFRYGELKTLPTIDYEVYSLTDNNYVLFDKDLLKIYKIHKLNRDYYLVLLNKNFKIYGNNGIFSKYNDKYFVYFLNFNQNVFTIRTNPNLGVKPEDVERYRIVIKDF